MGIVSGALTVSRFRVEGDGLPDQWRDVFRERIQDLAFKEPPLDQGKEEVEGWVQVHNLLDTDFTDFNRWLYEDYAIFALRVDKKRLPAKLFKATVDKECQKWCEERELQRCPAQVKEDIKERIEADWLARTLPSVAVTECAWSIGNNYLVLHTLSESTIDRFRKRFYRTFGMRLIPWSPLDFLGDDDLVDGIAGTQPTLMGSGSLPQLAPISHDDEHSAPAPGGA